MSPKSKNAEIERQLEVIRSGVEELIPEDELIRKLERSIASRKPLVPKSFTDSHTRSPGNPRDSSGPCWLGS